MKFISAAVLIFMCLTTLPVEAKTEAEEAASESLTAVTIFMDVNKLTRKNLAAKKMTKYHNEFAAYGYKLVSVIAYNENGDLEGFFLSYQKK